MDAVRDLIDKACSGRIPVWALLTVAVVLFLIAIRLVKGFVKFVFVVLALASLAGAFCWHFHLQGKL
jgi:hypothetical protein